MDKEIVHAVLDKMGDMLNIKVIAGAVLGLVTHKYSILMIGFGVLLYLDILTKWIAISYAYLVEQGNEAPAFFDAVKGINSARKARKINSTEMRTRGVSKLFVYCICFLMAAIFDLMSMGCMSYYNGGENNDERNRCIGEQRLDRLEGREGERD